MNPRMTREARSSRAILGCGALGAGILIVVNALAVPPFPPPGGGGGGGGGPKTPITTPTVNCAGSTAHTITLEICAPAGGTGLPAGFSIQWLPHDVWHRGADGIPGTADDRTWPSSDSGLLCHGSFSGNASGSPWSLDAGECAFVTIGALEDSDPGVSFNCNELECNDCYVFRVFGHGNRDYRRSDFTPDLQCITDDCDGLTDFPDHYCTYSHGNIANHAFPIIEGAFPTLYPSGLTVGIGNTLTFTTAAALQVYLPAPGGVGTGYLNRGNFVNPLSVGSTGGGNLAGQVLALHINIDMNPIFGGDPSFGDLVICNLTAGANTGSPLALAGSVLNTAQVNALEGQSINDILAAAEARLGGGGGVAVPYGLNAQQFNVLLNLINAAFFFEGCCTTSGFAYDFLCLPST